MFQIPARLKTISIVLMVIGVISIVASFLVGGGEHHEGGHGDGHGQEMHDDHSSHDGSDHDSHNGDHTNGDSHSHAGGEAHSHSNENQNDINRHKGDDHQTIGDEGHSNDGHAGIHHHHGDDKHSHSGDHHTDEHGDADHDHDNFEEAGHDGERGHEGDHHHHGEQHHSHDQGHIAAQHSGKNKGDFDHRHSDGDSYDYTGQDREPGFGGSGREGGGVHKGAEQAATTHDQADGKTAAAVDGHIHEIPEDPNDEYHHTSPRANPGRNQVYTNVEGHLSAETLHHQAANKPWANLMVSNFFWLAVALGALFFMAVQYAAQVGWTVVVLRVMEAMASFLWIPVLIMIVLVVLGVFHIGGNHLWHWMAEGIMNPESSHYDAIIAGKQAYLNGPFYIIRTLIYAIGWVGGAYLLLNMSKKMDDANADWARNWVKMRNLSAGFLVFFAVTSSMSAWDWIMSIDTHWFSTLFGWYVFAGMFVSALTVMTLITSYLKNLGYLPEVNRSHIQDLGKFMFAFSIFWTYLWFSQFMLIWYSNIPEEVTYYMARFGEYKVVFFTMVVMNFIFPILVLMSRDSKRNFGFLLVAGIGVIIGHYLDVFVMVMPGTVGGQWSLGLIQLGTFLGFAGLFMFFVFGRLAKRPLMPVHHPMFVESKHHHI